MLITRSANQTLQGRIIILLTEPSERADLRALMGFCEQYGAGQFDKQFARGIIRELNGIEDASRKTTLDNAPGPVVGSAA